jgi:hypothetical protein
MRVETVTALFVRFYRYYTVQERSRHEDILCLIAYGYNCNKDLLNIGKAVFTFSCFTGLI